MLIRLRELQVVGTLDVLVRHKYVEWWEKYIKISGTFKITDISKWFGAYQSISSRVSSPSDTQQGKNPILGELLYLLEETYTIFEHVASIYLLEKL